MISLLTYFPGDSSNWNKASTPILGINQTCSSTIPADSLSTTSTNLTGQMMSVLGTHPYSPANSLFGTTGHGSLFQTHGMSPSFYPTHPNNSLFGGADYHCGTALMSSSYGSGNTTSMDSAGWTLPSSKISESSSWNPVSSTHPLNTDCYR